MESLRDLHTSSADFLWPLLLGGSVCVCLGEEGGEGISRVFRIFIVCVCVSVRENGTGAWESQEATSQADH